MTTTPQAAQAAIKVTGLHKHYGGSPVLRGVNLTVDPGETYALLGPNGAGKSTFIEILEGFRRADSGELRVLGENPVSGSRAWRSTIGIVSQHTGDFGPATARELLTFFRSLYPNPRAVDETLELVGLTEHANKRVSKLSGGQKRRVDVALGIIGRPELLFLDEPTTGFDPEARRHFWAMLKGLAAEGTAILLTTHYLDEAAYLADRVGVLNGGTIVAEAPPAQLGGDEARVPIVRWRDRENQLQESRTTRPAEFVAQLVAEFGGEPTELEVQRPGLEEIYLDLIEQEAAA